MATSKRRTKSVPGRTPAPARRNPPSARRSAPRPPTRWAGLKRRAGWPLFALGVAVFLVSNIGARAGVQVLPFDRHHIIGQFGGAAAALTGLIWATTRPH
jgi:hypothetical protein